MSILEINHLTIEQLKELRLQIINRIKELQESEAKDKRTDHRSNNQLSLEDFKIKLLTEFFNNKMAFYEFMNNHQSLIIDYNEYLPAFDMGYRGALNHNNIYHAYDGDMKDITLEEYITLANDPEANKEWYKYYEKYEGLLGFQRIEDFNFFGIYAEGDCESPLYCLIYLSADNEWRMYTPKKGNYLNTDSNSRLCVNYKAWDDDINFLKKFHEDDSDALEQLTEYQENDYYNSYIDIEPEYINVLFDKEKVIEDIRETFCA